MTIVPLKLYFNEKGRAKLELALARGKKLHDKRETEKKRTWDRERARLAAEQGLDRRLSGPHGFVIAASAISRPRGLQPPATRSRSSAAVATRTHRSRR